MKTNITISVDSSVVDRARSRASTEGRTVTDAVRRFLQEYAGTVDQAERVRQLFARLNYSEAGQAFTREEMNER